MPWQCIVMLMGCDDGWQQDITGFHLLCRLSAWRQTWTLSWRRWSWSCL